MIKSPEKNHIKAILEIVILLLIAGLVIWAVFFKEHFSEKLNTIVSPITQSSSTTTNTSIDTARNIKDVNNLTPEELDALAKEGNLPDVATSTEYSSEEYNYRFSIPDGLTLEERTYFSGAGVKLPNHIVALREDGDITEVISLATFDDDGSGLTNMITNYLDNQGVAYAESNIQKAVLNESMGQARNMLGKNESFWFFFHPTTGNFHVLRYLTGRDGIKEKAQEVIDSLTTLN